MTLQLKAIDIAIMQLGKEEIPRGSNWGSFEMIYSRGIAYPKCSGIYKIKNIVNGKVYVGSALNLEKRIKNHIWGLSKNKHRNIILQQAIEKYGVENFYFIILELCEYDGIAEREKFWIDYYQSYKKQNGYNIQPVPFSNKSNKLSEATKSKIREYQKGRSKTIEHNLKNSIAKLGERNPNYGKPISDKLRSAIIESNKRRGNKK